MRWVRDVEVWQRDSVVIDSLAALVRTDSLFRLSRAMLAAESPARLFAEVVCERWRLAWRHGARPASLAIGRMEDTVFRRDDETLVARMWSRVDRGAVVSLDQRRCGEPGFAAPPAAGGTPLHGDVPRPEMPRRL